MRYIESPPPLLIRVAAGNITGFDGPKIHILFGQDVRRGAIYAHGMWP